MIVGHAMLAFGALALVGHASGWSRTRTLWVAAAAAGFALVPDIDMSYALVGVLGSGFGGVWAVTESFWNTGLVIHRDVTHSLVLSAAGVFLFTLVAGRRRWYPVAGVLAVALVSVVFAVDGILAAAMLGLFIASGVGVVFVATRIGDLTPRLVALAAGVGLLTHPFGDVFTGTPPLFLYPFDQVLIADTVTLVADPTLNLLAIFGLEISTVWLAVLAYAIVTERTVLEDVDRRSIAGTAFAVAAFVLPAPTLDVSYHFVFGLVGFGIVTAVPLPELLGRRFSPRTPLIPDTTDGTDAFTVFTTGVAAITVGGLAYTLVYLVA